MFVPLHDGAPLRYLRRARVTQGLLVANVAVFLFVLAGGDRLADLAALGLGFIPSVFFGTASLSPDLWAVPAPATLVTAAFLHGGWLHLGGNMLFLWVFGDNVEDAMGSRAFLVFYLACAAAGAYAFGLAAPGAQGPLIGASGAVAGVVAAYVLLYPRMRVWGLMFQVVPVRVPAFWCIGAWMLFQLGSALFSHNAGVGWWAHVGGMLAGGALTPFMKRRAVPLFGPRAA